MRASSTLLGWASVVLAALGACRGAAPDQSARGAAPAPSLEQARPELRGGEEQQPLRLEGEAAPDPLAQLEPPDLPGQQLAFSHQRLAWLDHEQVRVLGLDDFAERTRFAAPGARNLVALTGGGFLIAGQDHVQRLSDHDSRPELLPRAPRLGPTTIIVSRHEAQQFWLYYAGIALLPRFDLGAPPGVAGLVPILDYATLFEFDRQALLGLGDGSFVYTCADGLRRLDVEGRREHLPAPELAGRVWALGRDARLDRVWAATRQHLYLLRTREQAEVLQRHELPAHVLALATEAGTAAALAVEDADARSARLRVQLYLPGSSRALVVRFSAAAEPGDAAPRLAPELTLDPERGLFAAHAFGLHVFDYRRGVRLYPPSGPAQKLAPGAL